MTFAWMSAQVPSGMPSSPMTGRSLSSDARNGACLAGGSSADNVRPSRRKDSAPKSAKVGSRDIRRLHSLSFLPEPNKLLARRPRQGMTRQYLAQHLIQNRQARLHLLLRHAERRTEPNPRLAAPEQQEPLLERGLDDRFARLRVVVAVFGDDVYRSHQAESADQ